MIVEHLRHPRLEHRPDLRPLFGQLSSQENEHLLDRFAVVEAQLKDLAAKASTHVGVPYQVSALRLVLTPDGRAAGVIGGPSGDAGDIWFDIGFPSVDTGRSPDHPPARTPRPPWMIKSLFVIFCSDSPEPPGGSSTHTIFRLEGRAATPDEVLDVLEAHIRAMEGELYSHPPRFFTNTPHDVLQA